MSTISDSDFFIINRGSTSYKVSAADVKSELGGAQFDGVGRFDTPVQVLTPVNGAGLTTGSTYQPFTTPSLEDLSVANPNVFQPQFASYDDIASVNEPVTQCGPDGEDYRAQIGEVLSVTSTNYTAALKISGTIVQGTKSNVFDGRTDTHLRLGPGGEFDFTDCNLPIAYTSQVWFYGFSSSDVGAYIQVTYSDGTVVNSNWNKSDINDSVLATGKAVLKLKMVGGDPNAFFSIYGARFDCDARTIGPANVNYMRDGLRQLNFAPGSNELRYAVYGQMFEPHNEMIAYAGWKRDSMVLFSADANSPDATSFVPGDNVVGPALTAYASSSNKASSGSLSMTGLTGQWFAGLCVKGSSITASAPSAESVEFTSANFNTTPVTGTNVSLTNRRWSLESSPNESGPWSVVGSYDDDSANFSQNGADKWEGKPTLQGNTYYRVKVRYDSGNAPSEESAQSIFKTA